MLLSSCFSARISLWNTDCLLLRADTSCHNSWVSASRACTSGIWPFLSASMAAISRLTCQGSTISELLNLKVYRACNLGTKQLSENKNNRKTDPKPFYRASLISYFSKDVIMKHFVDEHIPALEKKKLSVGLRLQIKVDVSRTSTGDLQSGTITIYKISRTRGRVQ